MLQHSRDVIRAPTDPCLRLEQFEPLYWMLSKVNTSLCPPCYEIDSGSSDSDTDGTQGTPVPERPKNITMQGILRADAATIQSWLPIPHSRSVWLNQRQLELPDQLHASTYTTTHILLAPSQQLDERSGLAYLPVPPPPESTPECVHSFDNQPTHTCEPYIHKLYKVQIGQPTIEAGSHPRGHLWVTWGVYLCAGKPPLADIILSHPPDLT